MNFITGILFLLIVTVSFAGEFSGGEYVGTDQPTPEMAQVLGDGFTSCPRAQVMKGNECDWLVPVSFWNGNDTTLYLKGIYVFGSPDIYDLDLYWDAESKSFSVERMRVIN